MDIQVVGIVGFVIIVGGGTWGICSLWERLQWQCHENAARQQRAQANAPVTKIWVEDVAWTPWSSTISRWALKRKYEWTDVRGNIHSECDSWEEVY